MILFSPNFSAKVSLPHSQLPNHHLPVNWHLRRCLVWTLGRAATAPRLMEPAVPWGCSQQFPGRPWAFVGPTSWPPGAASGTPRPGPLPGSRSLDRSPAPSSGFPLEGWSGTAPGLPAPGSALWYVSQAPATGDKAPGVGGKLHGEFWPPGSRIAGSAGAALQR